jgi:hypothetical protein
MRVGLSRARAVGEWWRPIGDKLFQRSFNYFADAIDGHDFQLAPHIFRNFFHIGFIAGGQKAAINPGAMRRQDYARRTFALRLACPRAETVTITSVTPASSDGKRTISCDIHGTPGTFRKSSTSRL